MARPTTKISLLETATKKYDTLLTLIQTLTPEEQIGLFPFEGRDKQLRDCLIHLHEWHLLFITWSLSNKAGNSVPFLPPPYDWKNYAAMNLEFWKKHQHTSLNDAKEKLATSHQQCLDIIGEFSDEELFTKKYFNWTGSTSLGSYAVSATSSHYEWAIKIVKQYANYLKKQRG